MIATTQIINKELSANLTIKNTKPDIDLFTYQMTMLRELPQWVSKFADESTRYLAMQYAMIGVDVWDLYDLYLLNIRNKKKLHVQPAQ